MSAISDNSFFAYREVQPLVSIKSKFSFDRGRHRESVIAKRRLGRSGQCGSCLATQVNGVLPGANNE